MITINFDSQTNIPLYEQLYKSIRSDIESGRLQADEKMPSKRRLAAHLKVSIITVETAYAQLTAEGYLKSVPKVGYFVQPYENKWGKAVEKITANIPAQKQAKDEYCYDFKTNVVDTDLFPFSTWARLGRQVLSESYNDLLNITHPQGSYALRREIVRYLYDFRGIEAIPEQIVVGAGSEYLLALLVQLLGRKNIFGVENPGYPKIARILEYNDVSIVPLALDQQGVDMDSLHQSDARIIHVTPSHQFPSGIIMPVSRRMSLLDWANEKEGRYIIEDDYDSEFRFNGQPIPALQGLDHSGKVIYINSFTKSIAPSLRISYMVLPQQLLQRYTEKFRAYSCTVPNFEQYTLSKFLEGGYFERHLNRMRNVYKERRDLFVSAVIESPLADKIEIIGQNAGLHLLMKVTNGLDEHQLVGRAKAAGVRVYGLSEYYSFPPSCPESTVVIGYSGIKPAEMKEAVNLLIKSWKVR